MVSRIILLYFLLLSSSFLGAQIKVLGKVVDIQNNPVKGVNVILKTNSRILSFDISTDDGNFSLEIEAYQDSLFIEAIHMSFRTERIPIEESKDFYLITLSTEEYVLPEISIEAPPPVKRNGDTLIFDIESYTKEKDENLEQILERLPGIQVASNGKITYQGLDISKFYIEGLDMLRGRYQIATKNLGINNVKEIQIIERHQPIKALDSINRPENAAINLKLKSGVALTGTMKSEVGIPFSGLLSGNLFGFTKKQQFHLSGSYNDLGESISSNYNSLYRSNFTIENDLIRLDEVREPFVLTDTRAYLENNELTSGINFIKKLGEDTEFNFQGFIKSDKIVKNGSELINYFLEDDNSSFTKEFDSSTTPFHIEGLTIFQYNGHKTYTKVKSELKIFQDKSNADNLINEGITLEQFEKNSLELNSIIDLILNHKNKALQFKSEIQYLDKDYLLDIKDAFIFSPDLIDQSYFPELRQWVERKDLTVRFYTNFYVKKEIFRD